MSLQGKRVVVTRSAGEQNEALCRLLAVHGVEPIAFPVIRFVGCNPPELETAVLQIEAYDWLLFTSGNGVRFFWESISENGQLLMVNCQLLVGVVGSATLQALEGIGLAADFVPETFSGEALVRGLGCLQGKRVLLPRAKIGRPEIVAMLEEQGAIVDDIGLYDTITAVPTAEALAELERGFDAVIFTSPSSVRNFVKIVPAKTAALVRAGGATVACIGPVTTEEAKRNGLIVNVQPEKYRLEELVAAVTDYFW